MSSQNETLSADVLERLYDVIAARKGADPDSSYTAGLYADGPAKIAQKLGEEAVETVIASLDGEKADVIAESADLLYHLLVLWADREIPPGDVWAELARREGRSGIDEKNSRGGD